MEFKVIKRNGNAVIPDGMFKLCGMEDAKLISMVQLNGGILLMPESVSIVFKTNIIPNSSPAIRIGKWSTFMPTRVSPARRSKNARISSA